MVGAAVAAAVAEAAAGVIAGAYFADAAGSAGFAGVSDAFGAA